MDSEFMVTSLSNPVHTNSVPFTEEIVPLAPLGSWQNPVDHYIKAIGSNWYKLIFKLQSLISIYTFDFFKDQGMCSALFPITTGSISSPMGLGSDSLPVKVTIANQATYLADSMQFMLEYALRFHEKGVFYLMPSFRGEDADARHLCQFYHSEAEICGKLNDVIILVEQYIKFLSQKIMQELSQELHKLGFSTGHVSHLINLPSFPRIRFDEALKILNHNSLYISKHSAGFGMINNLGESILIQKFSGPVWLTHLPQLAVPFYQADEDGTEFSLCADLLMGIGETVGAGERHADPSFVLKAMRKREVIADPYAWYLKMREIAPLKTSGFGMGVERYILWFLQCNDIRDCQIVPRFNHVNFIP